MESEYLQQTVGPVLTDAIAKLLQHGMHRPNHPQNPLDFLASFLMQHYDATQTLKAAGREHERIATIQKEVLEERMEVERELDAMREAERVEIEAALESERSAREAEIASATALKLENERIEEVKAEEEQREAQRLVDESVTQGETGNEQEEIQGEQQ